MSYPTATTLQEVIDKTLAFLEEQGEPSALIDRDDDGFAKDVTCKYRARLGYGRVLKCAAGYWMPDDLPFDELEAISIGSLTTEKDMSLRHLCPGIQLSEEESPQLIKVLTDLQYAHDTAAENDRDDFAREVRRVLNNRLGKPLETAS